VHHDKYFAGEEGFVEIKYYGWTSPYIVIGDYHYYIFDTESRVRYVDSRDEKILLDTIEDGVKIFGNANGTNESQDAERLSNK
jgi:hypothetical protein